MKQLAIGALALVVSFFVANDSNAQSVAPKTGTPAVVDLSKPLPATLDVTVGQSISLENGNAKAEAKETDGKGRLFRESNHAQAGQTARYYTVRVGSGEISVTQNGKTEKITVNVMYPPRPARRIAPPTNSGGPMPRPKAALIVDLSKTLPAKVSLTSGQSIVFINTSGKVEAADTDGKGTLLKEQGHKNQITVFQASRDGTGEITVTIPGATPRVEKIAVDVATPPSVQPAPAPQPKIQSNAQPARLKATVTVDLSKALPKKLSVAHGQTVVFENGPYKVDAKETDSKGALFQTAPHNTLNQSASFRTLRQGKGEITVYFPATGLAQVPHTETIEVEVGPIPANVRQAPQPSKSGIDGAAIQSPLHGGPVQSRVKAANNFSYVGGATITFRDANNKVAATATSDKDGNFSVDLPPGDYIIESDHPQRNATVGLPRSYQGKVTVSQGQRSRALVNFDTGIR